MWTLDRHARGERGRRKSVSQTHLLFKVGWLNSILIHFFGLSLRFAHLKAADTRLWIKSTEKKQVFVLYFNHPPIWDKSRFGLLRGFLPPNNIQEQVGWGNWLGRSWLSQNKYNDSFGNTQNVYLISEAFNIQVQSDSWCSQNFEFSICVGEGSDLEGFLIDVLVSSLSSSFICFPSVYLLSLKLYLDLWQLFAPAFAQTPPSSPALLLFFLSSFSISASTMDMQKA